MDVEEAKAAAAIVALVLAADQVVLAAVMYRALPLFDGGLAARLHRRGGDVVLLLTGAIGIACLAEYGFDDEALTHGVLGVILAGAFALKFGVVKLHGPGWAFPLIGAALASLLVATYVTADGGDDHGRNRGRGGDETRGGDDDSGGHGRGRGRGGGDDGRERP